MDNQSQNTYQRRVLMLALQIANIKDFMSKLFLKDTFDSFSLIESSIVTANTFSIDGRIKKEYFTTEENKNREYAEYSTWEALRPFCFQFIKGKKTPLSIKLVFRFPKNQEELLLEQSGLSYESNNIDGFFLNIRYENSIALCTTGISIKTFSLDKSLELFWDQTILTFLKNAKIEFE